MNFDGLLMGMIIGLDVVGVILFKYRKILFCSPILYTPLVEDDNT